MNSKTTQATVQAVRSIQAPTAPRFDAERLAATLATVTGVLDTATDELMQVAGNRGRIESLIKVAKFAVEASAVLDKADLFHQTAFADNQPGQAVKHAVAGMEHLSLAAVGELLGVALCDIDEAFGHADAAEAAAVRAYEQGKAATVAGF